MKMHTVGLKNIAFDPTTKMFRGQVAVYSATGVGWHRVATHGHQKWNLTQIRNALSQRALQRRRTA